MKKTIWMAILAMLMFSGATEARDVTIKAEWMTYDEMDQRYKDTKNDPVARQKFLRGRALVCMVLMERRADQICDPSWRSGGDNECFANIAVNVTRQRGCNYPELKITKK